MTAVKVENVIKTDSRKFGRGLVLLLVPFLITTGCNYSIQKEDVGQNQPGGSSAPNEGANVGDPALNFQNVFETSIKTSCFTCHAAPRNAEGINLETYESVFANRVAVEQAVASRRMPDKMGRTMDADARDLLLRWLASGAPLNAPAANFSIESGLGFFTEISEAL